MTRVTRTWKVDPETNRCIWRVSTATTVVTDIPCKSQADTVATELRLGKTPSFGTVTTREAGA